MPDKATPIAGLSDLPGLWELEGRETAELVLPLRYRCPWHDLNWLPIEYDQASGIAYGLTFHRVPAWRHFHVQELLQSYGGQPVLVDRSHLPEFVPRVGDVRLYNLYDPSPFTPLPVTLP